MLRNKKEFLSVKEIKPYMLCVNIIVTVIKLNSKKSFVRGNRTHEVAEFLVGDRTGVIVLVVWDDMIEKIKVGESYAIRNLKPKIYMNQLRVVFTKSTMIEPAPYKIPLCEINST